MSASSIYLDSSAIVKFINAEQESDALRTYVADSGCPLVSCELALTEVVRAARRQSPAASQRARSFLEAMDLIKIDTELLQAAAMVDPARMRTLDAIHIAAASKLGLRTTVLVTYDLRMSQAAESAGLEVQSPGIVLT